LPFASSEVILWQGFNGLEIEGKEYMEQEEKF
jgi:hypothetical protein